MILSNLDIWYFPLGVNKGLKVKTILGLAAKNVVPIDERKY